jgi:hypothetical protein
MGAVGAALLLFAGLAALYAIGALPVFAQPFANAAFSSAMVIASFTWGLWQEWYIALFVLAFSLVALAARAAPGET